MTVEFVNCGIGKDGRVLLPNISWNPGETGNWLITGGNGSGKTVLMGAVAGFFDVEPRAGGSYRNTAFGSIASVSFESAAALIEEERRRDDSDFVEGGVDIGRTARQYICEVLNSESLGDGSVLESHPAVSVCGISKVLDRGLKYLSTGEIRKTVLCRALLSKPAILVLDEPFAGLDVEAKEELSRFLEQNLSPIRLFIVLDRYELVPSTVTNVLELDALSVSFCGTREEYEKIRETRAKKRTDDSQNGTPLPEIPETARADDEILVDMRNVTVEWSERKILDNLSWTLKKGEHWLIRGPNGSGKTTLLELITGDNPQVFRNDVRLFGSPRGSGETIWELKEKMGIVSHRLHTEYRSVGDYSLENVVLSGLFDSIGVYRQAGDEERKLARKWLSLAGFEDKTGARFSDISYGEQRAVLIIRAAIKRPPLLILDEPCHGLDDEHRRMILALLDKIGKSGSSTLLHVTHDPSEILPCERHVLELRPGEKPMYAILSR